jgi:phosphate transport system substrate-binding protein
MKQMPTIWALGAIALLGLYSCSTQPNSSVAPETTATSQPETTASTQNAIKVGGSSSTVSFLRSLETAYQTTAKNSSMTLLEPGQSENIIAGIKQGLIDVGAISRTLESEEDEGSLEFRLVAQDALLVATHPTVHSVTNLTTQDLQAIYSGRITNWQELGGPDAEIVVLDRPEDESAKRLLRQHYLGKDLKNASDAVVLRKEGELIQMLQSTPYSIGAFSLAYAISHDLAVNRLSLNGIEPSLVTLKSGKYPMSRSINLVWNKQATDATQAFLNYVFSPAGTDVLERAGFAPIPVEPKGQ